jgi:hypothetical protein
LSIEIVVGTLLAERAASRAALFARQRAHGLGRGRGTMRKLLAAMVVGVLSVLAM